MIRWADRIVGVHERHWGKHQAIHDPAHLHAAARIRVRLARITGPIDEVVQVRVRGDYDRQLDSEEVVI